MGTDAALTEGVCGKKPRGISAEKEPDKRNMIERKATIEKILVLLITQGFQNRTNLLQLDNPLQIPHPKPSR